MNTLPPFAVTPTDTRQPPRPAAQHPANVASREHSARVLNLALAIADDAARSDIECYALSEQIRPAHAAAFPAYSLIDAVPVCTDGSGPKVTAEDAEDWLRIVHRAADYIVQRGNVFPWRMVDVDGRPGWVRFVDKEGRPMPAGERP